jgi:hypothetical protein
VLHHSLVIIHLLHVPTQSNDLVLFNLILILSIDVLVITSHMLHLIAKFIVCGCQAKPSDGQVTLDELINALTSIARKALSCGGGAEAAAACEVVRTLNVPASEICTCVLVLCIDDMLMLRSQNSYSPCARRDLID